MGGEGRLRVGVVGTGALGRHHVRLLASLPGVELVGIVDADPARAAEVAAEHGATVLPDYAALLELAEAVVVAAPTVSHAELGLAALAAGRHVLVEKPIAATLAEADALVAAARAAGRVLAVGHVEFHNPAVQALLAQGAPARFVEAQRLGVFSPRSLDVDVVLDLMIHDLQILHALDPSPVAEVRATGIAVLSPKVDICNARIALASGCVATLTASRVSAERVRKLRVFQPASYVSLDYRDQEIKGFRLVVDAAGGRHIEPADLAVEKDEPLRRELLAFVASCRGEQVRQASGEDGRRALATALAVVEAIGVPVGG
jgi:predicted dehydrogenase